MYRIEVTPGEETVFRSIEELAVGIRNGLITPRARIYHNASQKWLPISLHPHYKKAMELPPPGAGHTVRATPVPAARPKARPPVQAAEPHPAPKPAPPSPAPRLPIAEDHHTPPTPAQPPSPIPSPIVAMQKAVLRDLPVVAVPEPLPWTARAAAPPPPPPEPAPPAAVAPLALPTPRVHVQPAATVTFSPTAVAPEPVSPWPPEPVSPWPSEVSPWPPTPVEEARARPTARRSLRAKGRPLLLIGVAAALVVGAHVALTRTPSASADTSDDVPADTAGVAGRRVAPAERPDQQHPAATTRPATAARVSSAPARVPMTPGPAFAGSVPAAPGATPAPARPPVAAPSRAQPSADSAAPAIAPAPVEMRLALPELSTDSLVPSARAGDTMAMKKILRALNGSQR